VVNHFRRVITAALVVLGIFLVLVGCVLRDVSAPEWLQPDTAQKPPQLRPWAVEADCYSQLARVKRILEGKGLIQNHFTVENWPEGLVPSTTAPFDYVILLLYAPLRLVTHYPLDWAGAVVSPVLWGGMVCFWMLFRSREFNLTGRFLFLAGSAALPAFVWGTAFGRPRHQSLILALMAIGLTAEYERWHLELTPKRAWHLFAGVVWGLACWTSLFEPVLAVACLVVFNLIARRRENTDFLVSFGVTMLVALLVEGPHIYIPPPQDREALARWLGTIAEVRGVDFATFIDQMTLGFLALPFVAWGLLRREGDRRSDLFLVLLTGLLCVLTIDQRRWIYYANLGELFLMVRFCQEGPVRWTRLAVASIFLVGLGTASVTLIKKAMGGIPADQPSIELAEIARSIDEPGGIMAPWWLSPGLLYFSGQPIVSGSSHCGISGNVDSAKFYTTSSWLEAEQILKKRQVRWIMVFDDTNYVYPVLNVERAILGLPDYTEDSRDEAETTVWQILVDDRVVPTSFRLRAVTPTMKLYEYDPDG
jgi:hypothetical protein